MFVAIAIIVVLAKKLTKVDVAVKLPDSTNPDLSKMVNATLECLLTKEDWDGNNLCAYTYVVAAASIIISGLISLFLVRVVLQCCTLPVNIASYTLRVVCARVHTGAPAFPPACMHACSWVRH